jgi:hypothetical protein
VEGRSQDEKCEQEEMARTMLPFIGSMRERSRQDMKRNGG